MAELLWRTPGGPPGATGVVPLVLDDRPVVALPWAQAATARSAASAGEVALVLSDPRLTGSAWRPLVLSGRPALVEDGDGSLFTERLLDQELRKHPPSRALADSPMLRREHWWYLPRLVLVLDPVRVGGTRRREGPTDAVLAVDDGGLHVGTVRVADWEADPVPLRDAPTGVRGPAVLVGQEVSVPDVERWTVHTTTGRYADGRLADARRSGPRELEPVPGLLARVRRQWSLERACVRELRAAGHA
ncbi:pyridoxamine 5'-phosphate oxidase family protein [Geodermatophilus marinus]|uniref:pyridoxamine 5'-phosphate oxidase family protein n=1 Tax=Geodermatophilus sp. LHW52908 TaxID=2303986 RepID=UPI000E3EAC45|nr:pyridoxamine 5'-phosphate oxidase family protein [Geodermatophilus sp. LHW52908]RFU21654.1 pyridoxamine 5'-phosphate oxidase family protein [Geodermatophilus sp. LHW52908]